MNHIDIGTVLIGLGLLWGIWVITKWFFKIIFLVILAVLVWGYSQYGHLFLAFSPFQFFS